MCVCVCVCVQRAKRLLSADVRARVLFMIPNICFMQTFSLSLSLWGCLHEHECPSLEPQTSFDLIQDKLLTWSKTNHHLCAEVSLFLDISTQMFCAPRSLSRILKPVSNVYISNASLCTHQRPVITRCDVRAGGCDFTCVSLLFLVGWFLKKTWMEGCFLGPE